MSWIPRIMTSALLATIVAAMLAPAPALGSGSFSNAGSAENPALKAPVFHNTVTALENPRVVPPSALPGGKTYGEWAAAYTQWAVTRPISHTFLDDGQFFAEGQTGPVWFVQPGCMDRTYTLPAGKFLWAPIWFGWNEYPCPFPGFEPAPGQSMEDFLLEGLASFFPTPPPDGALVVDGVPLVNLAAYYCTSSLFTVTFDPSLLAFDPCVTGTPQPCVAGGYYVMLRPLSVGSHTLEYPGCDTIHVNVVPGGGGRATIDQDEQPTVQINWGLLKAIYR